MSERVEREFSEWKEKYEIPFNQEFNVKMLLNLREAIDETPNEHIRNKRDLIHTAMDIEQRLHLTSKEEIKENANERIEKILNKPIKEALIIKRGTLIKTALISVLKDYFKDDEFYFCIYNEFDYDDVLMPRDTYMDEGTSIEDVIVELLSYGRGWFAFINDGIISIDCAKHKLLVHE
jgi:hypothetical protein